jgi:TolB-like protein
VPSIFLSYASDDRQAARTIGDALAKLGMDVWLDQSELGGGDAWDQKIRKQIRECDYFMPIVSARTEARHEGYFRREWRLAVERTLDMADDHLFLLPVVIDATDQAHARVPEKFLRLETLCRRILSGEPAEPRAATKKPGRENSKAAVHRSVKLPYPPFPREEPGQRARFGAHVLGWLGHSAWVSLQRLPRWVRISIYVWLAILVMSRGLIPGSDEDISHSDAKKLKAITDQYRGSTNPSDIAKLGAQIASEFSDSPPQESGHQAVLAIPFAAPGGDAPAEKLADAAFAQTYGRLSMAHHGQIGLDKDAATSVDAKAAFARARAGHAAYVVYGSVDAPGPAQVLSVTLAKVDDGSVVWTQSYPVATAEPTKIAEELNSKVPALAPEDE